MNLIPVFVYDHANPDLVWSNCYTWYDDALREKFENNRVSTEVVGFETGVLSGRHECVFMNGSLVATKNKTDIPGCLLYVSESDSDAFLNKYDMPNATRSVLPVTVGNRVVHAIAWVMEEESGKVMIPYWGFAPYKSVTAMSRVNRDDVVDLTSTSH